MNASVNAARAGVSRGLIELRQRMTSPELIGWLWPSLIALVVMFFLRDTRVPGTEFSLASQSVPGILAMNLIFTGMMGTSMALTMERDDGTLLRMKATPHGTTGYLVGKVVSQTGLTTALMLILLIPASLVLDGLSLGLSSWLTLLWVLVLGFLATLPLGAVFGAAFSQTSVGYTTMFNVVIIGISGVFYPISAMPGWLQVVAQVFPVYWLGLGMRSALLPSSVVVAEVDGSWRHLETVGVLGAWAVLGFVLAPIVLRKLARRPSGSRTKETV